MKRLLAGFLACALFLTSTPYALADGLAGIHIVRPPGSPPLPTAPPAADTQAAGSAGAPVAGDLTHLTFTATTNLWTRIESPEPEAYVSGSAVIVEVVAGLGQGAEVRMNDRVIPFSNIGRRTVDTKTAQTRYTYYGVPVQSGPNHLVVTPLGAGDLRGTAVSQTVFGPGDPATFTISVEGKPVADGTSVLVLHVSALDASKHPAMPGSAIKATIAGGDASFLPDAPPVASAVAEPRNVSADLAVQSGGTTSARILAGRLPGDVVVQLASGSAHSEERIFFAPALRAPMVVGLATVGIGSVPAAPGEDPGQAYGANSRRGRIALYASGDVGAQTLATLAYDTAGNLTRTTGYGAFAPTDDLANRPYQTYGDASVTHNDALSNDHLYLRLDHGHSNFTWGEFQAQTGATTGPVAGDGFNLLVDGAKVELATSAAKLMAFNARNNIAFARQIFNPLGLSSIGSLLHPNIVVGSDIVTLVVLDRSTGAILQQTTLAPNVDYTLDDNTGQLRFINIPLPFDQNFNPQEIVVQYEYDGPNVEAETTGGRLSFLFGASQKTHLGIGYVNDSYGAGNYSLLSADLGGVLPGGAWSIEHLTSQGQLAGSQAVQSLGVAGGSGSALRAGLTTAVGLNKFDASFDSTSAGFDNPFGGLSTPGLLNYRLGYTRLLTNQRGSLTLSYDHQQNAASGTSTSQNETSLAFKEKITRRFTVTAGINSITGPGTVAAASPAPGAAPAGSSNTTTQAQAGFDWLVLPTVDLSASRLSDISGGGNASQPAQTTAELGANLAGKGRVYLRELWSDAPAQSFASSTSSLTSPVSGTRSTAFGIQRSLGTATMVNSEYTIDQTGSGSNIYSSMGVQEKLTINKSLHGNATLQRARGTGQTSTGFNVYGFDLAYTGARLRANGSYQLRTGDGGGSTLLLGATGALSPDFSVFAGINNARAGSIVSDDAKVGIAYRPSGNDRAVTVAQYEGSTSNSSALGTRNAVLSIEQVLRPTNSLELAGRYAYKLTGDAYYPAETELFGVRAVQRVGSRFDLGAEVRYLDVRKIAGASATGFAVEAGARLGDNMRLAAGYNFSGAPDPALAAAPTRRGVYITLTSVIDHILGWGR